jgi:hypothetical protein
MLSDKVGIFHRGICDSKELMPPRHLIMNIKKKDLRNLHFINY